MLEQGLQPVAEGTRCLGQVLKYVIVAIVVVIDPAIGLALAM